MSLCNQTCDGARCGVLTGCGRCPCPFDEGVNLPGRTSVAFGRCTYPAAFGRMRARLSAADLPGLRTLTARAPDPPLDPALALLDAWACVGHVLDFYGERLVNEHFLRTCRRRRSAVELGRLVGYAPRPGVAADAYLAFTLDDLDPEATLQVPAGTRAYTQPGPGEVMQPFETTEPLEGRPRWSLMRPRLTAPQQVGRATTTLYLSGTATGLRKGDRLLVRTPGPLRQLRTVAVVEALTEKKRTRVELETDVPPVPPREPVKVDGRLLQALLKRPAVFTADRARLALDPGEIFREESYAAYGVLESAYPELRRLLGVTLGGTTHADATGEVTVHAMRVQAALHGHNAPLLPAVHPETGVVKGYREWNSAGTAAVPDPEINDDPGDAANGAAGDDLAPALSASLHTAVTPLEDDEIALDAVYDGILPDSYVVLVPPASAKTGTDGVHRVLRVRTTTRPAFNLPARVTVLTLEDFTRKPDGDERREDRLDRSIVVYAQSEVLDLAEVPMRDEVCRGTLQLDGYYSGLQPGRRVIVSGERTDLLPEDQRKAGEEVTGVPGSELVMISAVEHRVASPRRNTGAGSATTDTLRTVLQFADPGLQFCYRRETVQILGNVAHATHGESRAEVLGGGDAARPQQTFPIRQGPLTYVSADTTTGVASTLEVRVEGLRWYEATNAAAVSPGERRYLVQTDDDGDTRVTFGLGARLPTGADNVRSLYRSGLGAAGNARAGQISVLASRPNGATAVTNPLAATGGADRDDLDDIRQRVPVGLTALDRLVSVADLEDFTRAFAGIGKARVTSEPGPPTTYRVVVAAVDDAPLTAGSALLTNLRGALVRFGDLVETQDGSLHTRGTPRATVAIVVRKALMLAMRARIETLPEHPWEDVYPRLRSALFAAFGFRARDIGQVPYPGEAMAVMQGVRGVAWVDLRAFGTIATGTAAAPRPPAAVARAAAELLRDDPATLPGLPPDPRVMAGEIAYLSPVAAGTLLLEPVT